MDCRNHEEYDAYFCVWSLDHGEAARLVQELNQRVREIASSGEFVVASEGEARWFSRFTSQVYSGLLYGHPCDFVDDLCRIVTLLDYKNGTRVRLYAGYENHDTHVLSLRADYVETVGVEVRITYRHDLYIADVPPKVTPAHVLLAQVREMREADRLERANG